MGAGSQAGSPPSGPRSASEGDAKRFGRNFASTAFAQLVAQLLTFGVSVLLARKLDVAAYGIFVFGFAFPSWFLLLISLGMDEVMSTQVAAHRSEAARYLTLVSLLRVFLGGVAMVALWVATQFVLADPTARTITLILGASSIITTFAGTFITIFRAFEKFEYAALITIAERSFTVGVAVVLLSLGYGLYEVSLSFLAGSLVLLVMSVVVAKRRFAWFTRDVRPREVSRILRLATPFALFNAVGTFTYTAGVVLLTLLRDPVSTGLFNAAFTLLLALFSFLSIVSVATLPMMSRINVESRERLAAALYRIQRLSVVMGVPLALGGWIYAGPIITTFYGDRFLEASDSFRVLVLCFAAETAVMGTGPALAATGHAKEKLYIASVGAAITIALSAALIPSLGSLGVAYAFLASRIVSAILSVLAIRKYVAPIHATETAAKSIVAGAVMGFVLLAVPGLSLWTGVFVGGLVYFAVLLAVRGMSVEDRAVVWNAIRGALFR